MRLSRVTVIVLAVLALASCKEDDSTFARSDRYSLTRGAPGDAEHRLARSLIYDAAPDLSLASAQQRLLRSSDPSAGPEPSGAEDTTPSANAARRP